MHPGRLCLVVLTASSVSCSAQSMVQDLRHRNPAIHWPAGYDPSTAALFSHNARLLPVACPAAFHALDDAEKWPAWLVFVKNVQTPQGEPLREGTTFSWSIFGNPIQSTVKVYEQDRQIGWLNLASHYYQAWLFQAKGSGCLVTTEEIGVGEMAVKAAQAEDTRTHRAHDLWLSSLQWIALGGTNIR